MTNEEKQTPAKAYWKGELAALYNVSEDQLRSWIEMHLKDLKKVGYKTTQKRLTVAQVELIFAKLGRP